ncbi:hypothetical protein KY344_02420, partial [Candidatus Woesearchaeota archaeon]|nr:hypothetical protein [Candidatus Woesearchaeota archaeon]
PKKYYGVLFNLANVDIDLFHTAYPPLHREVYLFSYSNILKKPKPFLNRIIIKFLFKIRGREPPRRPFLPLPLWYNKIVLNDVMAMHMQTVKSKERLLERPHMLEWNKASQEFKKKYNCSFDTFFEHTKKSKKGEIFIEQTQKNLRLFDRNKYNYPDILKKWIKDKLHTEIKQTKDFDKKLRNFLDK